MKNSKIPIARPSIGSDELESIRKVFETGWLGLGSVVYEFENDLRRFLGADNVIAVNTGTSALHVALEVLDLKKEDEVIVPSFTFIASIQAIICSGAKPVFCEIKRDTLNIDPEDLKKKINPSTRAIIPVHYGGFPCEMDEILNIAHKHSIVVVEDAAHAFGSTYKGRKIGSFGDITCFSFDPIKNITCGEGGALVIRDSDIAQSVIKKRNLGIDKDTWHRYKNERSWFYEVTTKGFRYHMSNINAAIGIVQLKKIEKFIQKKRDICLRYDSEFCNLKGIEILQRDYRQIAPFNYVIKVKDDRDGLLNYLREKGVDAGIHYIPNHSQPLFKKFYTHLPVTEEIYGEILSLPLYFDMEDRDISSVIEAVTSYFKYGCRKKI